MSAIEQSADWCADDGDVAICGTRMVEYGRQSLGIRWCFTCRARHEFWRVCLAPDGMSYSGPIDRYDGVKDGCRDLFPGWYREAVEA